MDKLHPRRLTTSNNKLSLLLRTLAMATCMMYLGSATTNAQRYLNDYPDLYKIIVGQDNDFLTITEFGSVVVPPKGYRVDLSKSYKPTAYTDLTIIHPDMRVAPNLKFLEGLEYRPKSRRWIYTCWNEDTISQVYLYDRNSGEHREITCLSQRFAGYVLKPIGWGQSENIVYLEASRSSNEEHLGVFELNLQNVELRKLNIDPAYMSSPIPSPDGGMLVYAVKSYSYCRTNPEFADQIMIYDVPTGIEYEVHKQDCENLGVLGWIDGEIPWAPIHNDKDQIRFNSRTRIVPTRVTRH